MTRSSRRRLPRVLAAPVVAGSLFLCSDLFPRLSLTTYTGRALNWSIAMDQSLGLLLETSARAQPAAPAKPTVESGDSTLTVSWKQPEGYPDSQTIQYDIEYSEDGSSIWRPWYIPSQLKNLEVKIPGLKNGTTYSVRVRARDGDVYGQWSALEKAMPVGVPSAPTQLNVIPGDQNLKLSWVAPVDLAGSEIKDYEVEYSSDSGETQTLWNEASKSTTLSDQITNLKNGTTYHLRVRAINKMGHGPWSDWAMGQPTTVPAAPNKPTLTASALHLKLDGASASFLDNNAQQGRLAAQFSRDFSLNTGRLKSSTDLALLLSSSDPSAMELSSSLNWLPTQGRLSGSTNARVLLFGGDRSEWGIGGGIVLRPGQEGEGLSLSLQPSFGQSGANKLQLFQEGGGFSYDPTQELAVGTTPLTARFHAEVAYGFRNGTALLTPYTRLDATDYSTTYGAGIRYQLDNSLDLDLSATGRQVFYIYPKIILNTRGYAGQAA